MSAVNCDQNILITKYYYLIMYDITGFQRDLLYVIAGLDDPHGLRIKDILQEYFPRSTGGLQERL